MKRHLSRLRRIALVLLGTWLVACGVLAAIVHRAGTRIIDQSARADVVVVLGAALTRDGKPYRALTRRSEHAAQLWKNGHARAIICTGGVGPHVRPPRSEADGCREVLMREGVPRTSIVLEEASRSTEENARNARDIMAAHGWAHAILVSDSYHVFRAGLILGATGVTVVPSPVPVAKVGSPAFYVHSVVREVMALQWRAWQRARLAVATSLPFP